MLETSWQSELLRAGGGPVSFRPSGKPVARFSVVDDVPERLAGEWRALAGQASEPNPFAEAWFASAALRHLREQEPIRLLEARRGERLIGVALLKAASRYGRTPVSHVQNWSSSSHFLGTPLIAAGEERLFWRSALAAMDGAPWARGFLHLTGLVEGGPVHSGLVAAAQELGRGCDVVHRENRPWLHTSLSPDEYYRRNVRSKRRSEHRRDRARLAELGTLELRELEDPADAPAWIEAFLRLEAMGWKGRSGSALSSTPSSAAFFRETISAAARGDRLQFLRLDLDGEPIAMTTCLLAPPGAFGFKSAFDERYSRFSPGTLLQIDQLGILERADIAWTDSCSRGVHPTSGLWSERRRIVRVTVRLAGLARGLVYGGARMLEEVAKLSRRAAR